MNLRERSSKGNGSGADGNTIVVSRPNDLKMKSLHGLTRTLVYNMVTCN